MELRSLIPNARKAHVRVHGQFQKTKTTIEEEIVGFQPYIFSLSMLLTSLRTCIYPPLSATTLFV
jgi:hypothetical protein